MNPTSAIVIVFFLGLAPLAAPAHAQNAFRQLREAGRLLHSGDLPPAPGVGAARDATPPKTGILQQISDEVSALYRKVSPSVVRIVIEGGAQVQKAVAMRQAEEEIDRQLQKKALDEEFQAWIETRGRPHFASTGEMGAGSGFVIDSSGLILTNDHVVKYSALGAEIKVRFVDGKTVPARVLWLSPNDDIALIRAQVREPVPSLALADSARVRVGEVACALGNPLGFESVFTCGTVTALNPRYGIQHDAPITNGNSGGPLLNAAGEVIGINHMVIKTENGNIQPGMGFAIPINLVKQKALR